MNIEYLHEFIMVARTLNFREAAHELCLSPSALSKHIAAVEDYFDTRLFTRDAHNVSLTESGVFLLDCAEVIESMLEESKAAIRDRFSSNNIIRTRGVLDNSGSFPVVVQAEEILRRTCPDVTVRVETSASVSLESLADQLVTGVVDCVTAYDAAERLGAYPQLAAVTIGRVPLEVTMGASHTLAAKDMVRLADLNHESVVHLMGPRYSSTWRRIVSRLRESGVAHKVKPIVAATPYDAVAALNALEDALFLSPRRSLPTLVLRNPDLVTRPIEVGDLTLDLDMIALNERLTSPLTDFAFALREVFREFYPETAEADEAR